MQCCCFIGSLVGNIEPKACAEVGDGSGPDVPAVPLENASHDGQADAGPGQVRQIVQALEDPEKSLVICHVEADAIVVKIKNGTVIGGIATEANLRLFARFGKFPCILEQMLERELQEEPIAEGREPRHDSHFDIPIGVEIGHPGNDPLREFAQVDDFFVHDMARDTHQLQQAVEQLSHVIAGLDDMVKIRG